LEAELNLDPDSNPDPDPELITGPDPNLQKFRIRMHNTGALLRRFIYFVLNNLFPRGLYILVSIDVTLGKKCEKEKRKRGKCKRMKKRNRKRKKGENKRKQEVKGQNKCKVGKN
jgi:hypothetical protein